MNNIMAAVIILELMTEMTPVAMSSEVVTADAVAAVGGEAACGCPIAALRSAWLTVPAEQVKVYNVYNNITTRN